MRVLKIFALMGLLMIAAPQQADAQGFFSIFKNIFGGKSQQTEQVETTQQSQQQSTQQSSQTNATSAGSNNVLNTIGGILTQVIGANKVSQQDIIGTWNYKDPSCAFTSDNLLAQAGGTAAASQVEQKMATAYSKIGLSSSNTQFVFNEDKTFSAKILGKNISGTYEYDPSTSKISLKNSIFTAPCYVTRDQNGMNLLFETTKLMTLFQKVAQYTNNSTLQTISNLSQNFNGMRMGMRLSK